MQRLVTLSEVEGLITKNTMFITLEDLNKSIYDEQLNAIVRNEPTIIDERINLAITEVDTYLNQRYNTTEIWNKQGADRHELIKNAVIDIALYHIHSLLTESPIIRRERYDNAIQLLKDIRKGDSNLTGVPLIEAEKNTDILYGGINTRY